MRPGLRDVLGEFRARALFILDEAHHAAPAGGFALRHLEPVHQGGPRTRGAVRASPVPDRDAAQRPFQQLLGAARDARSAALHARGRGSAPRISSRSWCGGSRRISAVSARPFRSGRSRRFASAGLPEDAPELELARRLAAYGELRMKRISPLAEPQGGTGEARLRRTAAAAAFVDCRLRPDLEGPSRAVARMLDGEDARRAIAARRWRSWTRPSERGTARA